MAATLGLYENTKLWFLEQRISQVQSFGQKLQANGVAILSPPGGHAVYIDMDEFFYGCDRQPEDFASVGFTLQLIEEFGIRSAESGPFAWQADKKTPEENAKVPNLVRFAVPRNTMSDGHINFTVAAIKNLHQRRHAIPNVEITRGRDMPLRHFSAGMQPVPPTRARKSYHAEARRQLRLLSEAVGQDAGLREGTLQALALTFEGWGDNLIPDTPGNSGWLPTLSNDHTPWEYSMALDQRTGECELRFMVEAQASENSFEQYHARASEVNEAISNQYALSTSFDRYHVIRDLFSTPPANGGGFALWHSFSSSKALGKWKLYMNPLAFGRAGSLAVAREALERLDYHGAWEVVERILSVNDFVVYVGLGCQVEGEDSEIKVYIAHPDATSTEISRKHSELCPQASIYEIQQFLAVMSGNSHGPYGRKPVLTTLGFKKKDPKNPHRTVHFPIDHYVTSDAEAQERIERYMDQISAPAAYREKYRKAVNTVQRRPLAAGRGIHSWVSLKYKSSPGGRVTNTFYLSPETYGPL